MDSPLPPTLSFKSAADRRQHPRFVLQAGYSPLIIRRMDDDRIIEGTAYDISRGGMRFEADEIITPGSQVAVQIDLPGLAEPVIGFMNVVWIEDEEDPAPYKMASVFAGFASEEDESRLFAALAAGRYRAAA